MSTTHLRDASGSNIGYIRTESNGKKSAYGKTGSYLGCYTPANNTTYNENGSVCGQGDMTSALVYNQR
ncbi:hypothetical protein [Entomobacter blattae]|uniref:Uncharacterized protein n=1 Tax=Entomobacter blattae TaxID=2762277 RepID=A0A7H1NS52_9PROT|nr:hypothetical protein [Entomobacter blattae]QNT78612.1 hypothetical protein JGUZn3_13870 [Entomobacter blattae]